MCVVKWTYAVTCCVAAPARDGSVNHHDRLVVFYYVPCCSCAATNFPNSLWGYLRTGCAAAFRPVVASTGVVQELERGSRGSFWTQAWESFSDGIRITPT